MVPRHGCVSRARVFVRVGMVLVLTVVTASAQAPPDSLASARRDEAFRLFDESRAQYREGHFQRAVELLLQARALEPAPVLLYNLGRAYEGLGDSSRAIDAYAGYIREDPTARDRGAIEERIRTLRRDLEDRAQLERQRKEASKQSTPRPSPSPPRASPIPWVVVGAGAIGVGAGATFALMAQSSHEASLDEPVQVLSHAKQKDAERYATIGNACFVAGGVVAIAGITWGILSLRASHRSAQVASVGMDVGLGRIALRGTF